MHSKKPKRFQAGDITHEAPYVSFRAAPLNAVLNAVMEGTREHIRSISVVYKELVYERAGYESMYDNVAFDD